MRNGGKAAPDNLKVDNLWLLPSDIHLSGAEIELSHKIGRETRLREALAPIIDNLITLLSILRLHWDYYQ